MTAETTKGKGTMKSGLLLLLLYGITAVYAQEACSTEGNVRLQGLDDSIAGRVEICRNGVWGTVCGDSPFTPWSEKNGQVVCRYMGYSGALNSILQERLPVEARIRDGAGTPIHIHRVECRGHESSLDDCPFFDNSTCTHEQDVAVTCRPNFVFGDEDLTGETGDVRLIGDLENGRGIVQLRDHIRGFIGICPDDGTFDATEANIVCRQLGYDSGSAVQFEYRDEYAASFTTTSMTAQGFSCSSDDIFLTSGTCVYGYTSECRSLNLVGVDCVTSDLLDGSIRLFGGSTSREGRVEILINGRWGRVCNDIWSTNERNAACRQLGFGTDSVSTFTTDSFPGASNRIQPVWLGQVDCTVNSETLAGCSHLEPTGYADCYGLSSTFAALDCGGSDSGSGGLTSGAITGIVFAVIFIGFFVVPFGWAYGKEYWENRERYSVYRCLVWPYRACSRCLNRCLDSSPSRNTNTRTTGGARAVFSLSRDTPATHTTELTPTNRPRSISESEPEPERDEQHQPELIKTAPPSYQAASRFPAADPTDLPPPYPGPPKLAEAVYPTAPGAYPPPTVGASYPPAGAGVYPPGGPAYPPGGDLAYPPAPVPGAGLQGYPPPTQAGVAYPPTLELAYPPATTTAPYPVEIPQQHAPIDPVLAEELANAPREAAPGSVPGELPYPAD